MVPTDVSVAIVSTERFVAACILSELIVVGVRTEDFVVAVPSAEVVVVRGNGVQSGSHGDGAQSEFGVVEVIKEVSVAGDRIDSCVEGSRALKLLITAGTTAIIPLLMANSPDKSDGLIATRILCMVGSENEYAFELESIFIGRVDKVHLEHLNLNPTSV